VWRENDYGDESVENWCITVRKWWWICILYGLGNVERNDEEDMKFDRDSCWRNGRRGSDVKVPFAPIPISLSLQSLHSLLAFSLHLTVFFTFLWLSLLIFFSFPILLCSKLSTRLMLSILNFYTSLQCETNYCKINIFTAIFYICCVNKSGSNYCK